MQDKPHDLAGTRPRTAADQSAPLVLVEPTGSPDTQVAPDARRQGVVAVGEAAGIWDPLFGCHPAVTRAGLNPAAAHPPSLYALS